MTQTPVAKDGGFEVYCKLPCLKLQRERGVVGDTYVDERRLSVGVCPPGTLLVWPEGNDLMWYKGS